MSQSERFGLAFVVTSSLALSTYFARTLSRPGEGLFKGLYTSVQAAASPTTGKKGPYALSRAPVVQRTLELISDEYVDPKRIVPRDLLLAALNAIQRDVAQVLVQVENNGQQARIRADTKEMTLAIDDVKGAWDVFAHIRKVFTFLEVSLKGAPEIDLREIEYAACNGMLRTLDPHSVLFSPEAYKDFSVSTSGKFGGLGIVIAIRDKQLTIMNVMRGTPASRTNLKRFDRVVQINGESTQTMGLNEAVQRLRGDPKTEVTLHVRREGKEGWEGTRAIKLAREEIKVASVESKGLEDGVAYVRLKQFAERTAEEMVLALKELSARGHNRGLILDLRGNPGGLLDQARKVADAFLKEGTIVISDGRKEGREEVPAKDDHNEPNYPIVVLINSGSASASEIVAGALKNLDRAVIMGETSFGKGSVQRIERNIPPEGAALKLTIAQYLTPGDVSIQSVGITPDIEFAPMTVDSQEMDLTADAPLVRERDLSAHLSNAKAKEGNKPLEVLKYAFSRAERLAMQERNGDIDEQFVKDFPVSFAQKFLKTTGSITDKRVELIKKAYSLLQNTRSEEIKKVADELTKMNVDWSDDPALANVPFEPAKVKVLVEPSKPGVQVTAGDSMDLKVTITNEGTVPLFRLRASTKSDAGIFDGKEFVFGKIEPGKSRSWVSPMGWCEVEGSKWPSIASIPKDAPRVCRIPKDVVTRADGIRILFEEAHGHTPAEVQVRTIIKALPRPSFAYSYQIADDIKGNHDGLLQKGERASLYLTVKNVGDGRSYETDASLQNLSGDGLFLRDARFDLSNMQPGDERRVRFTFDVQPELKDQEAKLQLSVRDIDLRENANERIVMPIQNPLSLTQTMGSLAAENDLVELFESPREDARTLGFLIKGKSLLVNGELSEFVRLNLGSERFAFARKRTGKFSNQTQAIDPSSAWSDALSRSPPALEIEPPELVVRADKVKVKGVATDNNRVLDVFAFAGARKVYYKSNRNSSDQKRVSFDIDVPLRPGMNYISVWARENAENIQRRVFVIRRDAADGTLLETPKNDTNIVEEIFGGDFDSLSPNAR